MERSLARVREAHQKALATTAILEEEIEWLSHPLIRGQPLSKSRDCQAHKSSGQKRRHHQAWPEDHLAPYFEYHPSRRNWESSGEVAATKDLDLKEPLELGLEVTYFLRGSAESSEGENEKVPSPEPPVKEFHRWVTWKGEACEMPSCWRELMAVPEVEDWEKLAREVWASFWLPRRASELQEVENYHQAPPAPPCVLQKSFMPPPNSTYTCWDIWEVQQEKMVAYA